MFNISLGANFKRIRGQLGYVSRSPWSSKHHGKHSRCNSALSINIGWIFCWAATSSSALAIPSGIAAARKKTKSRKSEWVNFPAPSGETSKLFSLSLKWRLLIRIILVELRQCFRFSNIYERFSSIKRVDPYTTIRNAFWTDGTYFMRTQDFRAGGTLSFEYTLSNDTHKFMKKNRSRFGFLCQAP